MLSTLFLVYLPAMLGVLFWNSVACLLVFRRRRLYPWHLRYACYLAAASMLPGLICDIGGMDPNAASLLWAAWLYPGAFFLAAAANLLSLKREGFRWWLVPIPLFNLLLGLIYLTRYLAYLGVPIGLPLDGFQVGYAMAQSLIVFFLYIFFPILNDWPVLLLPASETRKWVRSLNLLPAVACGLVVGLILLLFPFGYQVASSWQLPLPETAKPLQRPDFRTGVVLRIPSDRFPTEAHFQAELAAIQDLGVRAVNLFLHNDLMADPNKAAIVGRFLERLRERKVTIILTADYPPTWLTHPPSNREDILTAMRPFHQFLATRYRPDILVPFIEPYGAFVAMTRITYPPAEWVKLLTAAIDAVHEVSPDVRCAVYLGQSEDDRALYRQVCQQDTPVDVVGFSFYAAFQSREGMERVLSKVAGWVKEYGKGREHWVFEFGQSPLTMGGERAQSHYVQWVTGWATRQQEMKGVCVFALRDYSEKLGLLNSMGRKRSVYKDYRRLITEIKGL